MTLLHVLLLLGFAVLVTVVGLSRMVERYIGWRYLFRRRRSRGVMVATAILGIASVALPLLFVRGPLPEGSMARSALGILAIPTMMLFVALLLLNFFSVFTTVSITGVFCGVATLIVVLAVTSGFQEEFQNKVLGVNAHVLVLKYGLDFSEYRDVMKKAEGLPHVKAVSPFVFREMMIANGPTAQGALVKGIVPGVSTRVLDIADKLVSGSVDDLGRRAPATGGGVDLPGILLGNEMAKKLRVKLGDGVRIVSPLGNLDPALWNIDSSGPKQAEFRVAGVFHSGFDEYDRRLVYISLRDGQALSEGGDVVMGVELRTDDMGQSDGVARALEATLGMGPYRVIDWRELNYNLFTALKLQKVTLGILLTLIVLVAAFGIIATLTMLVIDKTQEIAILKSVGMRSSAVGRLFQVAGLTIGAAGALAGTGLGLMTCFIISRFAYRLDPRVYLIDRLPVKVHPDEVLLTALITLGICLIATIYPSLRAARLHPVEGLRYE